MSRIVVVLGAVLLVLAIPVLLMMLQGGERVVFDDSPLHQSGQAGKMSDVPMLMEKGVDINARDEFGRTALHYAAENGHGGTVGELLKYGANAAIRDDKGRTAHQLANLNGHNGTAAVLASVTPVSDGEQILNPSLKYPNKLSFETAIGGPAVLLKGEHVWLFAPTSVEQGARVVHPVLEQAYDALYDMVGVHTDYIVAVYNFPKGHGDAFGGTSNCTIWYDDTNLRLNQHDEWTQYKLPHVSGYIEEMAHNFAYTQFGWEMIGWSIGIKASQQVADNPLFERSLNATRQGQTETFRRYKAAGHVFPSDVPPNQVDRIHAYLLWQCEQEYGPNFWQDFFKEAKKERAALASGSRDERYRITVECFDRLPGLNFKERLRANGISLTTDIKSMDPEGASWNRRLE